MEQIIVGVLLVIMFVVLALILSRGSDDVSQEPAYNNDDEGWIPLDLDPPSGYASVSQGGRHVGYAPMRRLHLKPGWQAGPKGMRPYTKQAREQYEREQRRTAAGRAGDR